MFTEPRAPVPARDSRDGRPTFLTPFTLHDSWQMGATPNRAVTSNQGTQACWSAGILAGRDAGAPTRSIYCIDRGPSGAWRLHAIQLLSPDAREARLPDACSAGRAFRSGASGTAFPSGAWEREPGNEIETHFPAVRPSLPGLGSKTRRWRAWTAGSAVLPYRPAIAVKCADTPAVKSASAWSVNTDTFGS